MKALLLSLCLVCFALPVGAQSADALKFAPRQLLLVSPDGSEAVLPMVFIVGSQEHLEFVPVSQIKDSLNKGGQPLRLGDVLAALESATQAINKLQADNATLRAENEKLWKVALKNNPQQAPPPTVVIQQPPPQPPSRLERYMLLRGLLPQAQPTQSIHITASNCTRYPALCVGR